MDYTAFPPKHRLATYSILTLANLTAYSLGNTFGRSPCGPIHIVMAVGWSVDFINSTNLLASSTFAKNLMESREQNNNE